MPKSGAAVAAAAVPVAGLPLGMPAAVSSGNQGTRRRAAAASGPNIEVSQLGHQRTHTTRNLQEDDTTKG